MGAYVYGCRRVGVRSHMLTPLYGKYFGPHIRMRFRYFNIFTPHICIRDQLWVISHAHVRKLVKTETQVQEHLEKVSEGEIEGQCKGDQG